MSARSHAARASVRYCRSTRAIARSSKPAARSAISSIRRSSRMNRSSPRVPGRRALLSSSTCVSRPRGKWEPMFSRHVSSLPVGSLGMIKEEVAFMTPGARTISRDEALRRRARVHRARGSRHAARRCLAARRDQLPDAARLGHGLHAGLQHDRAAGARRCWSCASRPTGTRTKPSSATCCSRAKASRDRTACRSGQALFVPREEITMRDCTDGANSATIKQSATRSRDEKAAFKVNNTASACPEQPALSRSRAEASENEKADDVYAASWA